jgi:hypothetical protein
LQAQLERSPSDVLILLDCCESGGSLKSTPPLSSGTTELIAASPFDTLAPGPGELSFTGALIRELKDLAVSGEMFSVVELHRRVLANIIRQRTRLRFKVPRPLQWPSVSPVYVRLTGGVEVPSIALKPLSPKHEEQWSALKDIETRIEGLGLFRGEERKRGALRRIVGLLKALGLKAPELEHYAS